MYTTLIHRVVILCGFVAALISLAINLARGQDLLYSAFIATCVLFTVAVVMLMSFRGIAQVLLKYLAEKKVEQVERERAERREREEKKKLKT